MLDEPVEHAACNIGLTSGKSWRFHDWVLSNAAGGSLYLDDYREFSIGAIVTPDEPLRMQFTSDPLDRLVRANNGVFFFVADHPAAPASSSMRTAIRSVMGFF